MSRVFPFVVSLLVKDCQYPRDPLQPARKKNAPKADRRNVLDDVISVSTSEVLQR